MHVPVQCHVSGHVLGGLELEYDVEEEGSGRDKTYIARVT